MTDWIDQIAQRKLIILQLIKSMGIPLSNSEICQFLLNKDYMNYFTVQQYLSELVDVGWLKKNREQNSTRYTLTFDGEDTINYFSHHIPSDIKNEIRTYAKENSKRIREEYAVTANYFLELNGDYLVKCSLCDYNGAPMMEISLSVVSKEIAQNVCRNWRKNVSALYGSFMQQLAKEPTPNEETMKASLSENKESESVD